MKKCNCINTYGYMCVKHNKYHMPIFVVEFYTEILHGTAFFSNAKDAQKSIIETKKKLQKYGINAEYDCDYNFDDTNTSICLAYMRNDTQLFSNIKSHKMYTHGA